MRETEFESAKTASLLIDEVFHELLSAAEENCKEYQLDPLKVPRIRPPRPSAD